MGMGFAGVLPTGVRDGLGRTLGDAVSLVNECYGDLSTTTDGLNHCELVCSCCGRFLHPDSGRHAGILPLAHSRCTSCASLRHTVAAIRTIRLRQAHASSASPHFSPARIG